MQVLAPSYCRKRLRLVANVKVKASQSVESPQDLRITAGPLPAAVEAVARGTSIYRARALLENPEELFK